MHAVRIARFGPIAQEHGKIPKRIAAGSHVPVDYRDRSERIRFVDHVVELEVGMEQTRLRVFRYPAPQPRNGLGKYPRVRQVGYHRAASYPALDGSAEEPRRTAECPQADLRRVDGVQHGEALDQLPAQSRADLRAAGQTGRQSVADNDPRAVFDDLEWGAQHARLSAVEQAPGRYRPEPMTWRANTASCHRCGGLTRRRPGACSTALSL